MSLIVVNGQNTSIDQYQLLVCLCASVCFHVHVLMLFILVHLTRQYSLGLMTIRDSGVFQGLVSYTCDRCATSFCEYGQTCILWPSNSLNIFRLFSKRSTLMTQKLREKS